MKRIAIALAVLVLVLAGLIGLRLRSQAAADRAPSGGSGEIEGTEVELSARIAARVLKLHVREGQEVRRGDLLVELDCEDARSAVSEATARLAAARAQGEASRAAVEASLRSRDAASAQQVVARAQAQALAAERDAARRQAARLEALAADVPDSSRDQTRAGAEGLGRRTEAAEAQTHAAGVQARAADASRRAAEAQLLAAEASTRAAEAALSRARLLADECRIASPIDGVVEELPREAGELAGVNQTLATVVDLAEVRATFYLPNAEVAAAKPGGAAEVVADAWPAERFAGRVTTVAARAEFTPRNIQTRSDRDRLVYPVEVAIPNPERKLRPGMPVQVVLTGTGR
jgi:HlyD family secretion protein